MNTKTNVSSVSTYFKVQVKRYLLTGKLNDIVTVHYNKQAVVSFFDYLNSLEVWGPFQKRLGFYQVLDLVQLACYEVKNPKQ